MEISTVSLAFEPRTLRDAPAAPGITLADGTTRDLSALDADALVHLQFDQECEYARRILQAPKGSSARAKVVCKAYDTVTRIYAQVARTGDQPLVMGLHPRHERLVTTLLAHQQRRGMTPRFFEIGYAGGALVKRVTDAGFSAAGIEVSSTLQQEAQSLLGPEFAGSLYLGSLHDYCAEHPDDRYSLVYWNDVFEHIPPDEIADYLRLIRGLLAPGGQLVTITPNWHYRPSDVTASVRPPRTEAIGLHLREYTLRQVTELLEQAGFTRVAAPLVVTRRRIVLCGSGLVGVKRSFEAGLEWLPFRAARFLCHRLGLDITIATA